MSSKIITDDTDLKQPHSLVMNVMGVGSFLVFFFAVTLGVVWFLSYSCAPVVKTIWRSVFGLLLIVTAIFMYFAPRTNKFVNSAFEPNVSVYISSYFYVTCNFGLSHMRICTVHHRTGIRRSDHPTYSSVTTHDDLRNCCERNVYRDVSRAKTGEKGARNM